jgi:hypothetical protein
VVFVHIPKTAGTTMASSLVINYPPERTINLDFAFGRPVADIEDRISPERRARLRLLWGHLPYGVHRYIPRPCRYITVLRDPIARGISSYKYIRNNPRHRDHRRVVEERIDMADFFANDELMEKRRNRQTRQLCSNQAGEMDREDLEEAKRNLERFLVVGLTERFEETFVLVRRALRLRIPFYVTRLVSPQMSVSSRAIGLIREQNQLDLELYGFAHELFNERISRLGTSFGLEVSMFKALRPLSRAAGHGSVERALVGLSHRRRQRQRGDVHRG